MHPSAEQNAVDADAPPPIACSGIPEAEASEEASPSLQEDGQVKVHSEDQLHPAGKQDLKRRMLTNVVVCGCTQPALRSVASGLDSLANGDAMHTAESRSIVPAVVSPVESVTPVEFSESPSAWSLTSTVPTTTSSSPPTPTVKSPPGREIHDAQRGLSSTGVASSESKKLTALNQHVLDEFVATQLHPSEIESTSCPVPILQFRKAWWAGVRPTTCERTCRHRSKVCDAVQLCNDCTGYYCKWLADLAKLPVLKASGRVDNLIFYKDPLAKLYWERISKVACCPNSTIKCLMCIRRYQLFTHFLPGNLLFRELVYNSVMRLHKEGFSIDMGLIRKVTRRHLEKIADNMHLQLPPECHSSLQAYEIIVHKGPLVGVLANGLTSALVQRSESPRPPQTSNASTFEPSALYANQQLHPLAADRRLNAGGIPPSYVSQSTASTASPSGIVQSQQFYDCKDGQKYVAATGGHQGYDQFPSSFLTYIKSVADRFSTEEQNAILNDAMISKGVCASAKSTSVAAAQEGYATRQRHKVSNAFQASELPEGAQSESLALSEQQIVKKALDSFSFDPASVYQLFTQLDTAKLSSTDPKDLSGPQSDSGRGHLSNFVNEFHKGDDARPTGDKPFNGPQLNDFDERFLEVIAQNLPGDHKSLRYKKAKRRRQMTAKNRMMSEETSFCGFDSSHGDDGSVSAYASCRSLKGSDGEEPHQLATNKRSPSLSNDSDQSVSGSNPFVLSQNQTRSSAIPSVMDCVYQPDQQPSEISCGAQALKSYDKLFTPELAPLNIAKSLHSSQLNEEERLARHGIRGVFWEPAKLAWCVLLPLLPQIDNAVHRRILSYPIKEWGSPEIAKWNAVYERIKRNPSEFDFIKFDFKLEFAYYVESLCLKDVFSSQVPVYTGTARDTARDPSAAASAPELVPAPSEAIATPFQSFHLFPDDSSTVPPQFCDDSKRSNPQRLIDILGSLATTLETTTTASTQDASSSSANLFSTHLEPIEPYA